MARPCKSGKVLTDKSQTKAEISARIEAENRIGGGKDKLKPPAYLSKAQKKTFRRVVTELESADILRNLDVDILAEFAFDLDMLSKIKRDINEHPDMVYEKRVISAARAYSSMFFRCCSELSLSPQSRAKIAGNAAAAASDNTKKLMEILSGNFNNEGAGGNTYEK